MSDYTFISFLFNRFLTGESEFNIFDYIYLTYISNILNKFAYFFKIFEREEIIWSLKEKQMI
jgi:hypothetical protein